jgi:hypothetical protein
MFLNMPDSFNTKQVYTTFVLFSRRGGFLKAGVGFVARTFVSSWQSESKQENRSGRAGFVAAFVAPFPGAGDGAASGRFPGDSFAGACRIVNDHDGSRFTTCRDDVQK